MLKHEQSGREKPGFQAEVLAAFHFLVEEFNFRVVDSKSTFVRFESTTVFANVYHGRASHVMGFEIGQLGQPPDRECRYPLNAVLELLGKKETTGSTRFQASTLEQVREHVQELASVVRRHAYPILDGKAHWFESLLKASLLRAKAQDVEMLLRDARKDVDVAWQAKDYDKVAEILLPVRDYLTPAEIKKLAYAEKRRTLSSS